VGWIGVAHACRVRLPSFGHEISMAKQRPVNEHDACWQDVDR
jgi:hypothetical protein